VSGSGDLGGPAFEVWLVVDVVVGDGAGCRPCPVFPLITGTGGSDSLAYVRMGATVDSAVREIRCQYVDEAGHKNLMDTTGSRRSNFEQLYEEYRLPVLAYWHTEGKSVRRTRCLLGDIPRSVAAPR
jgi:hypothetical protein